MPWPSTFPLTRYRLAFAVERSIEFREYAGSALRGVFGHALKQIACVTSAPECRDCPLYRSCAYPSIYETPTPVTYQRRVMSDVPKPFVLEPPPWGRSGFERGAALDVGLVLVGPALLQLPIILMAWRRALMLGLGPQHGTARLTAVFVEGQPEPIWSEGDKTPREHPQFLVLPPLAEACTDMTLCFDTPLRLQSDGRVMDAGQLTPRHLLMALLRRVANLVELQVGGALQVDFTRLGIQASAITGTAQLKWRDWERYSSRQQRHMVLGGMVGRWTLQGDLAPFWPLLYLGQWLHVGKNATFGLGHYRIESAT